MQKTWGLYKESKCHCCKKTFLKPTGAGYVYVDEGKTFCSWACLRKFQRDRGKIK